ncbi:Semialdehyde dehydrogenase, NAD-binding [Sesbania bispinosa]|nr:Semialdehyde dehydrogenase, NAD-binding [Sesbania bispinosa]
MSSTAFSSICFNRGHCWMKKVLRLLANHPEFGVALLTADRKAGQPISSVFPHLGPQDLPDLIAIKDANFSDVDAVFCCLPHGTTQEIIKGLPKHLKIVDLSADFRLRDISEYEEWYGQPHRAPDLQVGLVLFNYKRVSFI